MGDEFRPLARHARGERGEIRSEGRHARTDDVALHAGEMPRVKDRGAAGRITEPLDVGDERVTTFFSEHGGEASRWGSVSRRGQVSL